MINHIPTADTEFNNRLTQCGCGNNLLSCGQGDMLFIDLNPSKETPTHSCVNIIAMKITINLQVQYYSEGFAEFTSRQMVVTKHFCSQLPPSSEPTVDFTYSSFTSSSPDCELHSAITHMISVLGMQNL